MSGVSFSPQFGASSQQVITALQRAGKSVKGNTLKGPKGTEVTIPDTTNVSAKTIKALAAAAGMPVGTLKNKINSVA